MAQNLGNVLIAGGASGLGAATVRSVQVTAVLRW